MTKAKNRLMPCCVYLAFLAVSDTLMLILGLYLWIIAFEDTPLQMAEWECGFIIAPFFQVNYVPDIIVQIEYSAELQIDPIISRC